MPDRKKTIRFVTLDSHDLMAEAEQHAFDALRGDDVWRACIWPERGRPPLEQIEEIRTAVEWVAHRDGLRLVVLSASPYVLRAIQVYAALVGVASQVSCEVVGEGGEVRTLDSAEELYDSWVRPFEELEAVAVENGLY